MDSTVWGPSGGQTNIGFVEHAATWRTSRMTCMWMHPQWRGTPQRNDELETSLGTTSVARRFTVNWMAFGRSWARWKSTRGFPPHGSGIGWARAEACLMGPHEAYGWRTCGWPEGEVGRPVDLPFPTAEIQPCLRTTPRNGNDSPPGFGQPQRTLPHGSLGWVKGDRMQAAVTAARLAGNESSAPGETARSYRQTDVGGPRGGILATGLTSGFWAAAIATDLGFKSPILRRNSNGRIGQVCWPAFNRPTVSTGGPPNGCPTLPAPSAGRPHVGHGVGRSPWHGSRPKAQVTSFHVTQAPRSAPLLPLWSDETTWEPLAIWRSEGAVTWKRARMRAGVHMLALADQWWLEAWGRGPFILSGLCTSPQVSKHGNSKAIQTCRAKAFVGGLV